MSWESQSLPKMSAIPCANRVNDRPCDAYATGFYERLEGSFAGESVALCTRCKRRAGQRVALISLITERRRPT